MQIEQLKPMNVAEHPTPLNPFHQDLYHMGEYLGTNCAVMFPNHNKSPCPYLIVIDRLTGERIKITM